MKHTARNLKAISPVLAVLMMIAVAVAGSLVVYAWIMGYIGLSTERSGQAIMIQNIVNRETDLLVYVQNVGEGVAQLEEGGCLYVNDILVDCTISGVPVSGGIATLSEGKTATLTYVGGAALPGEKVTVKVTTLLGVFAEMSAYVGGVLHRWSQTYGGVEDDGGSSVVQRSDGGYVVAGTTYSFGAGESDAWLIKTDASGNMEWNRTYGGPANEAANSLIATLDGGYAIAGSTYSFGVGGSDFWLIKTDEYGNIQWSQTYGGVGDDSGISVVQTGDGGYAVAGFTLSFGAGYYDFWLVKTDSYGNMEWNRTYGGTDYDRAYSMVATSDGGYAIAGTTDSFGAGTYDFWLVKTNEFGNMEWNRTYGGAAWDSARSLIVTSDGGYALAGLTGSTGSGDWDIWLVKTDAYGNTLWDQTYGGIRRDFAFSLFETSDGGYAIAGYTDSFGAGSNDFWLVKTDISGNMEWSKTYGGTGDDVALSVVITSDGGYAITGSTMSFGLGNCNLWLVKTDRFGN